MFKPNGRFAENAYKTRLMLVMMSNTIYEPTDLNIAHISARDPRHMSYTFMRQILNIRN